MSTDTPVPAPAAVPATSTEDKTAAIVSYLTLLGFIVAIIIHNSKKTKLGAYHLRQTLGFVLCGVAMGFLVVIPVLGWIAMPFVGLFILVLWVMGLISAINGQMKPVPVLGEYFQKWFGNAFE